MMRHCSSPSHTLPRWSAILSTCILTLLAGFVFVSAGCGTDDAGSTDQACTSDPDCPLGMVCNASGQCIETDNCDFCTDDQVCLITDDNPSGSCSAPQCFNSSDCPGDDVCEDHVCTESDGCTGSSDCPGDQICTPAGQCVDDDSSNNSNNNPSDQCTDESDCPDGHDCVDGDCHLPDTDECSFADDCPDGQICDDGDCVTQDSNNGDNGGGPDTCAEPCSQSNPGVCTGNTPYCVNDCCIECIGGGDCGGGQVCEDGVCQTPSDCSNDGDCPSGFTCEAGTCEPPESGQSCDPTDPGSCPDGQICNEDSECEPLGGDLGCGLCNDDCTCPGDLTCDADFICTGCQFELLDPTGGCPNGFCFDGICIPIEL